MEEKRMVGDYEVIACQRIDGEEIIVGVNDKADPSEKYLCCYVERNELMELCTDGLASESYAEIIKIYGERAESPAQRIKDKDKRRAAYHRFYTDMKWGYAQNYDITLHSGSLGIECLSRGAAHVDFNDASPQSVRLLRSNLSKLKGELSFSVTAGDYSSLLMRACMPYDVIFIDPPYASESGRAALQTIASRSLLARGGVAVYERDRAFSGDIPGLAVSDERKYGITYLTFFENEGDI